MSRVILFPIKNGKKICSVCLKELLVSEFEIDSHFGKLKAACRKCCIKRVERWHISHKDSLRDTHYKSAYGISLQTVKEREILQDFKCAICKNICKLYVDHDHSTDKFRGLLCQQCNTGLGNFKDSIDILLSAIKYLKKEIEIEK